MGMCAYLYVPYCVFVRVLFNQIYVCKHFLNVTNRYHGQPVPSPLQRKGGALAPTDAPSVLVPPPCPSTCVFVRTMRRAYRMKSNAWLKDASLSRSNFSLSPGKPGAENCTRSDRVWAAIVHTSCQCYYARRTVGSHSFHLAE